MADFYLKKNDLLPVITSTLRDSAGVAVDLTTATAVEFHMKIPGGAVKVNAAAVVTSAATGEVAYHWAGADTDTAMTYDAEWEVTFPVGLPQTFPNPANLSILITDDLA